MRSSNSAEYFRSWPITSFRGDETTWSLSGAQRTLGWTYSFRPILRAAAFLGRKPDRLDVLGSGLPDAAGNTAVRASAAAMPRVIRVMEAP
jgi:hypothetical protein